MTLSPAKVAGLPFGGELVWVQGTMFQIPLFEYDGLICVAAMMQPIALMTVATCFIYSGLLFVGLNVS